MADTTATDSAQKAVVVYPPTEQASNLTSVFLAGTINMGKARNWQKDFISLLSHLPVALHNPRRPQLDWKGGVKSTDPMFREQVEWEMNELDECDIIAVFFVEKQNAPITLLELGLHAASGRVIVGCEEDFDKKGNVDIVCERYGITQVDTLEELAQEVEKKVKELEKAKVQA